MSKNNFTDNVKIMTDPKLNEGGNCLSFMGRIDLGYKKANEKYNESCLIPFVILGKVENLAKSEFFVKNATIFVNGLLQSRKVDNGEGGFNYPMNVAINNFNYVMYADKS